MTLKFWDWIIIVFIGCLVFFTILGIDLASCKDSRDEVVLDKKLLLFILDFQDFSCLTCLDSFLGLYRKLPMRFKTSNAWGILVVKNSEREKEKPFRIAEKKLKGFIRANHITFPILVDRSRFFGDLTENGSGVFLFDGTRKTVHRYSFPLAVEQFEEIFMNLME